MKEQLALLPGYLGAHLELSLIALACGVGISLPLGVWIARRGRRAQLVLAVAGVIQTIPSLALLALMVPALALLGTWTAPLLGIEIRTIGLPPALIALSLYSVLPILQTTVVGIAGVDPALVEAARGVGMSDRQRLFRVELPLALPTIMAGIRTSTVWVVGTATLSTPVGATSLGNYIFSGLQTRNFVAVAVGCLAAAGLAIVLDQLVRLLEAGLRRRRRDWVRIAGGSLAGLYLFVAASLAGVGDGARTPRITVGSKTFTEQYILGEFLSGWIQRQTGLESRLLPSLGSTVLFDAVRGGDVDLYVDYSGTIWATIMKRSERSVGREEVLREVREYLASAHGIRVPAALGFENTYALAMQETRARALGVHTLSDLARVAGRLEIGGDYEFFARAEWWALRETYGYVFRGQRSMDSALMYTAVANGDVDVVSAFSTDGRIAAYGLRVLEDDRGVIPPYDAIVLVGPRAARDHPELLAALARLEGRIDATAMRRLNHRVDAEGHTPRQVADELLRSLE